jgi:hypothetical protein
VSDTDAWQREVILRNEAADLHYAPYCLPCPGLVRMRKIEPHYWRCRCGAECDYRAVPAFFRAANRAC